MKVGQGDLLFCVQCVYVQNVNKLRDGVTFFDDDLLGPVIQHCLRPTNKTIASLRPITNHATPHQYVAANQASESMTQVTRCNGHHPVFSVVSSPQGSLQKNCSSIY